MGTRADFYLGTGPNAQWLGSVGYDGDPHGQGRGALVQGLTTERDFRAALALLAEEEDFTAPEDGWPWPWETSHTTDYAYAFADGRTWLSAFGTAWVVHDGVAAIPYGGENLPEGALPVMRPPANPFHARSGVRLYTK